MNKADQIAQDMRALGYFTEVTDDKRCVMCARETDDMEFSIDFEYNQVHGQFNGRLYCVPKHGSGRGQDHFCLMSPLRNSGSLLIEGGKLLRKYERFLTLAMAVIKANEEVRE